MIFGFFGFAFGKEFRPMSADRPDKVESAYTILPGNFQVETTLYSLSQDESDSGGQSIETKVVNINDFHLRMGVSLNGEIQFMLPTHIEEKKVVNGNSDTVFGAGDLTVRYRQNLHGNDSGGFAYAIMPYAKFPTAKAEFTNDRVEGGVMFPFNFSLPDQWEMGTMLTLERAFNQDDETWRSDTIVTWVFSRNLFGNVDGFFELYSQFSDDQDQAAIGTFDFGLAWQFTERLQLDAGMFIGLTEAAQDQVSFAGLAWLF